MAREDLHFRLRIPEDLKNEVEAAAAKSNRSMTAEIVERIANYQTLREFWAKTDSEMWKLERRAEDADALRAENEKLKHQVAFQEGIIASLRENIDVFLKHLASPDLEHHEVLDAIIADIKVMRGKG
jgi:hypothetical protein